MTCKVDGCDTPPRARGWCRKHYQRWRTHGNPLTVVNHPRSTCEVCGEPAHAKRLCLKHYHRWRRYGDEAIGRKEWAPDPDDGFWDQVNRTTAERLSA